MTALLPPKELDAIWAKSDPHKQTDGERLTQHTWNVLQQLADLIRLRPGLPTQVGVPRLWHRLFWACWLHDLGKAASGFQAMLKGGPNWERRHEVLSLAFIPWLNLEKEDRLWVVAAVVSHHKEPYLIETYSRDLPALQGMVAEVPVETLRAIWRWLESCSSSWRQELGLDEYAIELPVLITQDKAVADFQQHGPDNIVDMINDFIDFARPLKPQRDHALLTAPILLRGLIIEADHTASAHAGQLHALSISANTVLEKSGINDPHTHQKEAAAQKGSALLTAPTGSGKTEAALLWAAQQAQPSGQLARLFYTLPHQASMNAMEVRLKRIFDGELVGLQHGRSLLALYRKLMDQEDSRAVAQAKARRANSLAKLKIHPLRVFSPYQMLKAFYRLKGYEPFLADFYNATFIFDEIHAYEPSRLALILGMVSHLRQFYGARFLFMSATFPDLIKEELQEALGGDVPQISAAPELFTKFQRHTLRLVDGDLLDPDSLEWIARDAARRPVLVCCNTVQRAQGVLAALKHHPALTGVEKVLLHGKFNGRDRVEKEKKIRAATAAGRSNRQPILLISTQVVEVSLDIDLDTIYSDPAPLEALIQRFGRVNRRGKLGLADVFVYRLPDDGQGIYDKDIVQASLCVLEELKDKAVDESAVGDWLNTIYRDEIAARWQAEYGKNRRDFEDAIVRTLRAFSTDKDLEDRFNSLFDSVEVLPASLVDEYNQLVADGWEIEASTLLVPIAYRQLGWLKAIGKLERKEQMPPIVDVPYDSEEGLHLHD